MKPLNGNQTHPLTPHARSVLEQDDERSALNTRLIQAMGWKQSAHPSFGEKCWEHPFGQVALGEPPDFTRDVKANKMLIEWMKTQPPEIFNVFVNEANQRLWILKWQRAEMAISEGDEKRVVTDQSTCFEIIAIAADKSLSNTPVPDGLNRPTSRV